MRQWLATAGPDAPLGPSPYLETEFRWREVAGDLPGSAGRLVLERRCAHALFPDFDYRLRVEIPGRPVRTFVLPFGDNRTCVSVFFAERDGRRLLYLQQTCGTGVSIDLDALRFATFEPSSIDLIGAFLAVTTGFEYVDVLADRARARRLFRAAADQGETYGTPLEALEALEAAQRDPAASP